MYCTYVLRFWHCLVVNPPGNSYYTTTITTAILLLWKGTTTVAEMVLSCCKLPLEIAAVYRTHLDLPACIYGAHIKYAKVSPFYFFSLLPDYMWGLALTSFLPVIFCKSHGKPTDRILLHLEGNSSIASPKSYDVAGSDMNFEHGYIWLAFWTLSSSGWHYQRSWADLWDYSAT